jgi:chromosome segregation ATPase
MSVTHGAGGGAGHAAVVSQVEHLQRALREAQAEAARFSSLLEQQRRESDRLGAELLPARKALAAQRAEQERGARELALARQLRAEAEARRGESDEALRRLEGRLVRGREGAFLLEQNAKLRAALAALRAEHEEFPFPAELHAARGGGLVHSLLQAVNRAGRHCEDASERRRQGRRRLHT